ncbi:MAG: lysophospholipid acyltransferase family protein [Sphaerochaetaceae bacterium]|nr:lysophospholipid acyltransferase family protein [Sphaerochaetaceae bacterium]MDD3162572.1 lysophospholipid acyltransferase family protein [Sphaerochaetaceae bacterium]MDD4006489.1 lysophospholipid acyltransferase family protein [Sphaerochaetaceae bacterium]
MIKIAVFFELFAFTICLIISLFVVLIPVMLMRLFGLKKAGNYWARICGTAFCYVIFWLINLKVTDVSKVHYDLDKYPRLCFIANHTSIIDVPAIVGCLHVWTSFIAKYELSKVPFVNFWISSLDCVFMKRGSIRDCAKAIDEGVIKVENGTRMTIFPEGTRSKNGKVGEFKGGSFKLATRSKAVIIPLVIKGTRNGFETKKTIRRQYAKIEMLEPIDTSVLTPDELRDLPKRVEDLIREAYEAI